MGIFVRTVLYRLLGVSGKGHISDTWMWEKYNHSNSNNSNKDKDNKDKENDNIDNVNE